MTTLNQNTPPHMVPIFPFIPKQATPVYIDPWNPPAFMANTKQRLHINTSHAVELRIAKRQEIRISFVSCEGLVTVHGHGNDIFIRDSQDKENTNYKEKIIIYAPYQLPYLSLTLSGNANCESDICPIMTNACIYDEATANIQSRSLYLQTSGKPVVEACLVPRLTERYQPKFAGELISIANGGSVDLLGSYMDGYIFIGNSTMTSHLARSYGQLHLFKPPQPKNAVWFTKKIRANLDFCPHKNVFGPDRTDRFASMAGMIKKCLNME